MEAALDLSTIIKLALTTGLCTAIFNQGFAWLRETIQRREKHRLRGKALALELVGMLTAYAQKCNSLINTSEYKQREGGLGRYDFPDLPPLPPGPSELLPSSVAAGLQDLRNEAKEAKRDIAGTLEVVGPPEAVQVANYHCAGVGYAALKLANRMRRHYRLGSYQAAAASSTFASELREYYRAGHRGPVRRLWNGLPIYKIRRRGSRLWRWLINLLPTRP
jgi:hypothetical protein